MDDLISRAAVLRCIKESREGIDWGQSEDEDAFLHYTGALYRTIASKDCLHAVDAVPVIRCKDCKYAMGTTTRGFIDCGVGENNMDFYCAAGERGERENEQKDDAE